ncbi:unnamed protein product [Plutella xylostella]|uniref:(diamondback moth) hypothetical protein n=1 Tax=Plutella xylostella TaxID=51655 RepID=A0A8S4EX02_PLUXY|nr:unnamed protein product [Plutella xylostella]
MVRVVVAAWGESLLALPKRWLSQGGPEDDFQNAELPKLPLPPLQATLDTYLEFAAVVASQVRVEHTRALVRAFAAPDGVGPKLQAVLEARREEKENWVSGGEGEKESLLLGAWSCR